MDPDSWGNVNQSYGRLNHSSVPHGSFNRYDLPLIDQAGLGAGLGLAAPLQHSQLAATRSLGAITPVNYGHIHSQFLDPLQAQNPFKMAGISQHPFSFDSTLSSEAQNLTMSSRYPMSSVPHTKNLYDPETRGGKDSNSLPQQMSPNMDMSSKGWGLIGPTPSPLSSFGGRNPNLDVDSVIHQRQVAPPPAHSSTSRVMTIQRNPLHEDPLLRDAMTSQGIGLLPPYIHQSQKYDKSTSRSGDVLQVHTNSLSKRDEREVEPLSPLPSHMYTTGSMFPNVATTPLKPDMSSYSTEMTYDPVSPVGPMEGTHDSDNFSTVSLQDLASLDSRPENYMHKDIRGNRIDQEYVEALCNSRKNMESLQDMMVRSQSGISRPASAMPDTIYSHNTSLSGTSTLNQSVGVTIPSSKEVIRQSVSSPSIQTRPPIQAVADSTTKPKRNRPRKKKDMLQQKIEAREQSVYMPALYNMPDHSPTTADSRSRGLSERSEYQDNSLSSEAYMNTSRAMKQTLHQQQQAQQQQQQQQQQVQQQQQQHQLQHQAHANHVYQKEIGSPGVFPDNTCNSPAYNYKQQVSPLITHDKSLNSMMQKQMSMETRSPLIDSNISPVMQRHMSSGNLSDQQQSPVSASSSVISQNSNTLGSPSNFRADTSKTVSMQSPHNMMQSSMQMSPPDIPEYREIHHIPPSVHEFRARNMLVNQPVNSDLQQYPSKRESDVIKNNSITTCPVENADKIYSDSTTVTQLPNSVLAAQQALLDNDLNIPTRSHPSAYTGVDSQSFMEQLTSEGQYDDFDGARHGPTTSSMLQEAIAVMDTTPVDETGYMSASFDNSYEAANGNVHPDMLAQDSSNETHAVSQSTIDEAAFSSLLGTDSHEQFMHSAMKRSRTKAEQKHFPNFVATVTSQVDKDDDLAHLSQSPAKPVELPSALRNVPSTGFLGSFLSFLKGDSQETLSSVTNSSVSAAPVLPKYMPDPRKATSLVEEGSVDSGSPLNRSSSQDNSSFYHSDFGNETSSPVIDKKIRTKMKTADNSRSDYFEHDEDSDDSYIPRRKINKSSPKAKQNAFYKRQPKAKKPARIRCAIPKKKTNSFPSYSDNKVRSSKEAVPLRERSSRKAKDDAMLKKMKDGGSTSDSDFVLEAQYPQPPKKVRESEEHDYDSDKDPAWTPFAVDSRRVPEATSVPVKPRRIRSRTLSGTQRRESKNFVKPIRLRKTTDSYEIDRPARNSDATSSPPSSPQNDVDDTVDSAEAYQVGTFLIERKDETKYETYPIWRVDSARLLKKYELLVENGKTLHQAIPTFTSFLPSMRSQYKPIRVRMRLMKDQQEIVEVLDDYKPKPPADGSLEHEYEGSPLVDLFNVYLQILLSQALEPGFLSAIKDANDEFYMKPLAKIDKMIKDKLQKIDSHVKWDPSYSESLKARPQLRELDRANLKQSCQACVNINQPAIKSVHLYGQPYDHFNLEEIRSYAGDGGLTNEFMIGKTAARCTGTYHNLYHFKYNLYKRCKVKVNVVKNCNPEIDNADILDQCLSDRAWVLKIFEDLKRLLEKG